MKAKTIYSIIILLIMSLCACRSVERLVKRSKINLSEQSEISAVEDQTVFNERIVSLKDSGRNIYKIKIFPVDTFTYSIQGGFQGTAKTIEIIGAEEILKNTDVLEREIVQTQTTTKSTLASQIKKVERSGSRTSKSQNYLTFIVIGALGLILVLWGWGVLRFRGNYRSFIK
ncbi:MAG: hypothetical protein V4721_02490 [Bacteroidota bacterium]